MAARPAPAAGNINLRKRRQSISSKSSMSKSSGTSASSSSSGKSKKSQQMKAGKAPHMRKDLPRKESLALTATVTSSTMKDIDKRRASRISLAEHTDATTKEVGLV
ncbi:uncharacterized protein LOC144103595 [Amblyomma americanum]